MIDETLKTIHIGQFKYDLEENKIAQNPQSLRNESKLLHYSQGVISHHHFNDLPNLLPPSAHLIVNNAKVIPARMFFNKASGAKIEVFLLEPVLPSANIELALGIKGSCVWQCMIGNLKRWKEGEILCKTLIDLGGDIQVKLVSREKRWVEFKWKTEATFGNILEWLGKIPLPPYIKREATKTDSTTYQTVFAKKAGAVAAPTAGLHFTDTVFDELKIKGISTNELTLYVGAGTFAPVTADLMVDHSMHAEVISISKCTIQSLLMNKTIVAIGTTSLRTLESLYWIGVKLHQKELAPLVIDKLYPYTFQKLPLVWNDSLTLVLEYMEVNDLEALIAETSIMIMPGYTFVSAKGLVTNFHYPQTTLIMLVAAFVGEDWRKIYDSALKNSYRFLSYGDSSLLWR